MFMLRENLSRFRHYFLRIEFLLLLVIARIGYLRRTALAESIKTTPLVWGPVILGIVTTTLGSLFTHWREYENHLREDRALAEKKLMHDMASNFDAANQSMSNRSYFNAAEEFRLARLAAQTIYNRVPDDNLKNNLLRAYVGEAEAEAHKGNYYTAIEVLNTALAWNKHYYQLLFEPFALIRRLALVTPRLKEQAKESLFSPKQWGPLFVEFLRHLSYSFRLNNAYLHALNLRGILHLKLQQNDLACTDFTQSLQLQPNQPDIYCILQHSKSNFDAVLSNPPAWPQENKPLGFIKSYALIAHAESLAKKQRIAQAILCLEKFSPILFPESSVANPERSRFLRMRAEMLRALSARSEEERALLQLKHPPTQVSRGETAAAATTSSSSEAVDNTEKRKAIAITPDQCMALSAADIHQANALDATPSMQEDQPFPIAPRTVLTLAAGALAFAAMKRCGLFNVATLHQQARRCNTLFWQQAPNVRAALTATWGNYLRLENSLIHGVPIGTTTTAAAIASAGVAVRTITTPAAAPTTTTTAPVAAPPAAGAPNNNHHAALSCSMM